MKKTLSLKKGKFDNKMIKKEQTIPPIRLFRNRFKIRNKDGKRGRGRPRNSFTHKIKQWTSRYTGSTGYF